MDKIEITFSTGHYKKYGGKRAVKAAWAIIENSTKKVWFCGFSMDTKKAFATAENRLRDSWLEVLPEGHEFRYPLELRQLFRGPEHRRRSAHNRKRLKLIRELVTIEIIELNQ